MSIRASSLNNYSTTAISREIGSKYDNVKLVATNIDDVVSLSSAIDSGDLANALNITSMTVAQGAEGSTPTWDGTTLTIPKGDTGEQGIAGEDAPTITGIVKTASSGLTDTYTITLSDTSNYTFEVTNGYTPVKGVDYDDGVDGKSAYEMWLEAGNSGTLNDYLTSLQGSTGPRGEKGDTGDVGSTGDDLTVEQIGYNGDGTFTWQFSDGTSFTTPDLTGPKGDKGDEGDKGDTGISVHHLKGTSTTDFEGDFGTFGEMDTYTFYGDDAETINLGHFIMRNGFATQKDGEALGVMFRKTYDADEDGVVDNAAAVGGKDLATLESERDGAIQAALADLGTNYSVADNTERLALTGLDVSDKVFVTDDGDGKWAQYWVTSTTDGTGAGSTFEVVMDEDTYLNANTAAGIKSTYESNPDTNAYTDAEKQLVDVSTPLTTAATTIPTAVNELDAEIDLHIANTNNPHGVTKVDVGLGDVDNTSDLDKPISTATQTALDDKVDKVTGKQLSTEDYTTVEKTRLDAGTVLDTTANTVSTAINELESTKIEGITAGTGVTVNGSDPLNPTVSATPISAAGLLSRVHATADEVTIASGTYYVASFTGTGSTSSISQTVNVGDNQKAYFPQDHISEPLPEDTSYYAGTYAGNISVRTNDSSDEQRYTVEVYIADGDGNVIDSGLASESIGDLGVKPLVVLSTGIIDLAANDESTVILDGTLSEQYTISAGNRIRFHTSGEKVGTSGGTFTLNFYCGSDRNSYIDVPNVVTTDKVINKSNVTGSTVTDALNSLNTATGLSTDQIDKNTAVTGTENLVRYDRILSTRNVVDMEYTSGDLTAVRYNGDDDSTVYYRDVLSYTSGNLTSIEHFYDTSDLVTPSGTTMLSYDVNDNLVSTSYSE